MRPTSGSGRFFNSPEQEGSEAFSRNWLLTMSGADLGDLKTGAS
jgi:hypothetical protein